MPPAQFDILQELGEGGFARVYKAREKSTGRTVALKLLKESLRADAEVLERFRREIFAVATIDSPYVVRMYDFGVAGGDSFLAMEFVEGTALRDLLVGKPWSATDVQVIIGQVCQALAAAHRAGIIHRDLKPENIMLVPQKDGTRHVKVLDFGFAKLLDLERQLELEPLTQVGFCFGTPQYMAPEQIQGRAVEPSVDLFAAAVIAYEMIAGQLPWDGLDAREVFTRVMTSRPPPIVRAHPSVTRLREVNELLQRALAKPKRSRPPSAESLFSLLEVALFGAPQSRGGGTFASVMGRTISIPNFAFDPTPPIGVPAMIDPAGEGSDPLRTTLSDPPSGDGTFTGGATFGGKTEVDMPPELAPLMLTPRGMAPPPMTPPPLTLPGIPHPPRLTPRHLRSGWQQSIANLPGVSLPEDDGDVATLERERVQLGTPAQHRSQTMLVGAPRAPRSAPSVWWLVLLAVVLAGLIGYYAGSLRH